MILSGSRKSCRGIKESMYWKCQKSTQIKEQKNIFVCMQKLIRLSGRNSKRRRKLCVEVKFYSNKILTNKDFETNIKGLRAIGDGASVTRGLQQASANGLSVAKSILNK